MSKLKGTPIPDDFQLTDVTLAWLQKRYPNVDAEIALERFEAWASQYPYHNWQKAFQNYVIREADSNKLGPMLRKAQSRGDLLKERAKASGFRDPHKGESFDDYEKAIDQAGKRDVQQLFSLVGRIGK